MQVLEQIPDTAKVAGSIGPTVITLAGYPVEQWMFVASAIVSIMFVIEKLPVFITRIKQLVSWVKNVKRKKQSSPNRSERETGKGCEPGQRDLFN